MERAKEQRLIHRAKGGDNEAFAALYEANVQSIFRYVVVRVSDIHVAEDLTGDVFMRALRSMPSYNDEGTPFLAWLYRIAHARVVDYYRKQGRTPAQLDLDSQSIAISSDLDAPILHSELQRVMQSALATLTNEQQQVIVLRFVEGHRLEETAQLMGKNVNAIKALQHRALRALSQRLARYSIDLESFLTGLS